MDHGSELRSRRHGTWYFSSELPSPAGDRRRVRRGGFTTKAAAVAALEALTGSAPGPAQGLRTGEWRCTGTSTSLPEGDQRRLGVIASVKDGPHLLTFGAENLVT